MKNSAKHSSYSAKQLTQIGLMTAIICIVGPFSIPLPFSPVPLSFTTLAIYLAVFVLGMKHGTCSCFLYLLLGTIGLPVFSGFSGGLSRLAGPTGGYLVPPSGINHGIFPRAFSKKLSPRCYRYLTRHCRLLSLWDALARKSGKLTSYNSTCNRSSPIPAGRCNQNHLSYYFGSKTTKKRQCTIIK